MAIRTDKFLRFPGGKAKAVTLSYDDGVRQDKPMVQLLREAGMKCTFNINAGCFSPEDSANESLTAGRMSVSECLNTYDEAVCEVAVHGYNHTFLTAMDTAAAVCEIADDRRALETMFGRMIRGMAYPYGASNDEICKILSLCGILYARTTVSTEKFSLPKTREEWLQLPATCHHKNPKLQSLCQNFLEQTPKYKPAVFYLWGHTYEFDKDQGWDVIRQFIDTMKGHEDIWYATNMELYQAWSDFENLETSADGKQVYNPNLRPVWFTTFRGNCIELLPGQTVEIE